MTTKPKPRARRKKAPPAFYTPVDGWKPRKGGMQTNTDVLLQIIHDSMRADPLGYWARVRDEMI